MLGREIWKGRHFAWAGRSLASLVSGPGSWKLFSDPFFGRLLRTVFDTVLAKMALPGLGPSALGDFPGDRSSPAFAETCAISPSCRRGRQFYASSLPLRLALRLCRIPVACWTSEVSLQLAGVYPCREPGESLNLEAEPALRLSSSVRL